MGKNIYDQFTPQYISYTLTCRTITPERVWPSTLRWAWRSNAPLGQWESVVMTNSCRLVPSSEVICLSCWWIYVHAPQFSVQYPYAIWNVRYWLGLSSFWPQKLWCRWLQQWQRRISHGWTGGSQVPAIRVALRWEVYSWLKSNDNLN